VERKRDPKTCQILSLFGFFPFGQVKITLCANEKPGRRFEKRERRGAGPTRTSLRMARQNEVVEDGGGDRKVVTFVLLLL
jgi:hypothetical protein